MVKISAVISSENRVSRRDFIRFSLLSGTAFMTFPNLFFADEHCESTSPDILGPYFVDGAPLRQVLVGQDEPGKRTVIGGVILGSDCSTPVAGAIIDSWSADDSGCYSAIGPCAAPGDPDRNLRGKMVTAADGKFEFEIVKPGFYVNGSSYRPSHVHYRVVSPDESIFVTQLYFEGDPYIADDPWASAPEAAGRIIPLVENGDKLYGEFNIKLNVNVTSDLNDEHYLPQENHLYPNFPNPFNGSTLIRYSLAEQADILLDIYDQNGRRIKVLTAAQKSRGFHQVVWDGSNQENQKVGSGLYFYRLLISSQSGKYVHSNRLLLVK